MQVLSRCYTGSLSFSCPTSYFSSVRSSQLSTVPCYWQSGCWSRLAVQSLWHWQLKALLKIYSYGIGISTSMSWGGCSSERVPRLDSTALHLRHSTDLIPKNHVFELWWPRDRCQKFDIIYLPINCITLYILPKCKKVKRLKITFYRSYLRKRGMMCFLYIVSSI